MARRTFVILFLLILITLLGGWLRGYRLAQAPPSANWDEASYGYNAYSLWLTGADEYGTPLPLTIRSFDDYKPPLYAYLTAPLVGLFGLSEFNTRLTSAIFGTLSILIGFILASRLTRSLTLGLITAAILATTPSLVHYSRLAFEAVPALTLFLISIVYFLPGPDRSRRLLWGLFFAALSFFSYNSHKIYFILAFLYWLSQLRFVSSSRLRQLIIAGLICLPIVYSLLFSRTLARFSSTSVFPLYQQTHSLYLFSGELVNRYFSYFSPANIFVRGTNEPNQRIQKFAVFNTFQFIFYLTGLAVLVRHLRRYRLILLFWLTAPLPAVITWSWFTPIRVLPHWFGVALIIALGLGWWWKTLNPLWRYGTFAVMFIWWAINLTWLSLYLTRYMPYTDSGQWQYGFREALSVIKPIESRFSHIVWESPHAQPHIFILFYSQYSPTLYQSQLPASYRLPQMRKVFDFGKFQFRKIYWPADRGAPADTLFVGTVFSLPQGDISPPWKILADIPDPEGYTTFRIVGQAP